MKDWLDVMVFKPDPILTGTAASVSGITLADVERAMAIVEAMPKPPEIVMNPYVPEGKGYRIAAVPNTIFVGPGTAKRLAFDFAVFGSAELKL